MAIVACEAAAEGTLLPVLTGHRPNMAVAVPALEMKPFGFFWNEAGSSKFTVVGHRGSGKNIVLPEGDSRPSIRENTIASFNAAAHNGAHFVEFDVQVTKDSVPIIFHDDLIHSSNTLPGTPINELTLQQFRAMGPQTSSSSPGLPLYRKTSSSPLTLWTADTEDSMCTLEEAFSAVHPALGFNIELKFDDDGSTTDAELHRAIDAILEDVRRSANGRMIVFSSFHPDAVVILRKKMAEKYYPVLFLTNGGNERYGDERRNSIEAAVEVCRHGKLDGIVSEVQAVLRREENDEILSLMAQIKALGLKLFTYGTRNNETEVVLKQQSWGIDGVIVDHVMEIVDVLNVETVPLTQQIEEPASPSTAAFSRRRVSVA